MKTKAEIKCLCTAEASSFWSHARGTLRARKGTHEFGCEATPFTVNCEENAMANMR